MAGPEDETAIPLETLQGDWVASRGEVIEVRGKDINVNGRPVPGALKLSADGEKVVGYSIYKATSSGGREVVWQSGYLEIIWRRPAEGEIKSRSEFAHDQTALQGQSRAAATLTGGAAWGIVSEQQAVSRLNGIIQSWREGPPKRVRSCDICPDWSNRAETGLSVDHVHYIASMITSDGFKSRRRKHNGAHDVPVLVRESAETQRGRDVLAKWRHAIAEDPKFPPFLLDGKSEFFCSLGNGHFTQALNLFRTEATNLWNDHPYRIKRDAALQEAIDDGVESVVLSPNMPMSDRRFVSEMLNKANGRKWLVGDDGHVFVDDEGSAEMASSQFEALSKVLDAEELSCLVRQKLHLDANGHPIDRQKDFEENRPSEMALARVLTNIPLPSSRL